MRKLTTILAADAEGFSSTLEADEEAGLAAVRDRLAVLERVVEAHGGRIFHRAGDGRLAEFSSPVEAVRAGLKAQRDLDQAFGEETRLPVRMGLHLGDVDVDDAGDLMGHAVNVAARLEAAAPAGGLLVSRAVWEQVQGLVRAHAEGPAPVRLAKMETTVEAWRLFPSEALAQRGRASAPPARIGARGVAAFAAAAVLTLGVAGFALMGRDAPADTATTAGGGGAERTRLASLAVLPFDNLSGDAEHGYFVDGLHDALITELAQIDALRVISRTSTLPYAARDKGVPQIAEELGVDGIVEASVLRAGDAVRIQVQLIQARPEESHLWAKAFDAEIKDVLGVQKDIVRAVAAEVGAVLSADERDELASTREISPEAYDLYLRGRAFMSRYTAEDFRQGVRFLERAADLAPDHAEPPAALALAWADIGHLALPPDEAYREARRQALKALMLDPDHPGANLALAEAFLYNEYDLPAAEAALRASLARNDNSARAHVHYGWLLDALGEPEAAREHFETAVALEPLDPLYPAWAAWWFLFEGHPDRARALTETALDLDPGFPPAQYVAARLAIRDGRIEDGVARLEALIRRTPGAMEWALGAAYAEAGREADARALIAAHQGENAADAMVRLATACALGDRDLALDALAAAVRHRHSWVPWIGEPYICEDLRGDDRFELLRSVVKYR